MKYVIICMGNREQEFDIKEIAERFCIVCNKGLTPADRKYKRIDRRQNERCTVKSKDNKRV